MLPVLATSTALPRTYIEKASERRMRMQSEGITEETKGS
jgi:hypothetical protein